MSRVLSSTAGSTGLREMQVEPFPVGPRFQALVAGDSNQQRPVAEADAHGECHGVPIHGPQPDVSEDGEQPEPAADDPAHVHGRVRGPGLQSVGAEQQGQTVGGVVAVVHDKDRQSHGAGIHGAASGAKGMGGQMATRT
jgi:hypothetical protein